MSTKRQLDPQLTRAVVDLRAVLALHSLPEIGACEAYQTWLTDRLTPFVDRKWLYAREALFQHGDAAKHYYLVIRGALLVQRRGTWHHARSTVAATVIARSFLRLSYG